MSDYWIKFLEFLVRYLPSIIGSIAQILFLWLPIDLKSWKEDIQNVMIYVGLQMFLASMIFLGIPEALDLYRLDHKIAFYLVFLVGLLSLFKVLKVIPLEASTLKKITVPEQYFISFAELFDDAENVSDLEVRKGYKDNSMTKEQLRRKYKVTKSS